MKILDFHSRHLREVADPLVAAIFAIQVVVHTSNPVSQEPALDPVLDLHEFVRNPVVVEDEILKHLSLFGGMMHRFEKASKQELAEF